MLRRLYDWTLSLAARPYALWALAVIAFTESLAFPIPPDVLIIPMVLATPRRAWLIAGVATVSAVLGALAAYAVGALLFDQIGQPILEFYGYEKEFVEFQDKFIEWGFWIVLIAGISPFPDKVLNIASGVVALDLTTFIVASVLARGARFFLVAGLLWRFGPPIRVFIEKYLVLLATLFIVLLIGGFVAIKYLV